MPGSNVNAIEDGGQAGAVPALQGMGREDGGQAGAVPALQGMGSGS
jgi:hypothetical protein